MLLHPCSFAAADLTTFAVSPAAALAMSPEIPTISHVGPPVGLHPQRPSAFTQDPRRLMCGRGGGGLKRRRPAAVAHLVQFFHVSFSRRAKTYDVGRRRPPSPAEAVLTCLAPACPPACLSSGNPRRQYCVGRPATRRQQQSLVTPRSADDRLTGHRRAIARCCGNAHHGRTRKDGVRTAPGRAAAGGGRAPRRAPGRHGPGPPRPGHLGARAPGGGRGLERVRPACRARRRFGPLQAHTDA